MIKVATVCVHSVKNAQDFQLLLSVNKVRFTKSCYNTECGDLIYCPFEDRSRNGIE